MDNIYDENSKKIEILLYWYIFGVPACLVFFAFMFTTMNVPTLVVFSFLLIVLYTGIVGILVTFTNAIISTTIEKKKNQ